MTCQDQRKGIPEYVSINYKNGHNFYKLVDYKTLETNTSTNLRIM